MEDFITATRFITITYIKGRDKGRDKERDKESEKDIESKIIVSTTAESLEKVLKTSNVRIYFFINKDGKESSCFEFDPFSPSITFSKKSQYFLFSKTISGIKQEIKIDMQNGEEEDGDDLDDVLEELFNIRNK